MEKAGKNKKTGKISRGQQKINGILAKMRRLQDEERIKRAENLNKLPMGARLAMNAAGMSSEELAKHPLLGEKVKRAVESRRDKGLGGLLGDEKLCKLVAVELAQGREMRYVAGKYGVKVEAVEEFYREHVKPVAEEMVNAKVEEERVPDPSKPVSIKDLPVNSRERLEVMKPFMSKEELRIADEWERELQSNSGELRVDVKDFHVFRKAYMARVALERKQTIREGLDEAAAQSLELAMRHRATDTVAAILQTMAQRKQRRDTWMEKAYLEGKYSALAPLDSNELKDLEVMIELSGLKTSVRAEESVAGDHGSSKDTSVVMIRMDGIDNAKADKAGKQIVDITPDSGNCLNTPDLPVNRAVVGLESTGEGLGIPHEDIPLHKRFALDLTIGAGNREIGMEQIGSVVERKREADDL